jgi:hypothetical protein
MLLDTSFILTSSKGIQFWSVDKRLGISSGLVLERISIQGFTALLRDQRPKVRLNAIDVLSSSSVTSGSLESSKPPHNSRNTGLSILDGHGLPEVLPNRLWDNDFAFKSALHVACFFEAELNRLLYIKRFNFPMLHDCTAGSLSSAFRYLSYDLQGEPIFFCATIRQSIYQDGLPIGCKYEKCIGKISPFKTLMNKIVKPTKPQLRMSPDRPACASWLTVPLEVVSMTDVKKTSLHVWHPDLQALVNKMISYLGTATGRADKSRLTVYVEWDRDKHDDWKDYYQRVEDLGLSLDLPFRTAYGDTDCLGLTDSSQRWNRS